MKNKKNENAVEHAPVRKLSKEEKSYLKFVDTIMCCLKKCKPIYRELKPAIRSQVDDWFSVHSLKPCSKKLESYMLLIQEKVFDDSSSQLLSDQVLNKEALINGSEFIGKNFMDELDLWAHGLWEDYRVNNFLPPAVPQYPDEYFSDKGWQGWFSWIDWIGLEENGTIDYFKYLGLPSQKEFFSMSDEQRGELKKEMNTKIEKIKEQFNIEFITN